MKKEIKKTIYNLELHEEFSISNEVIVQRVASGWNYKYYESKYIEEYQYSDWILKQIVFVPYDNKFQTM